jgi:hypothetical protein
MSFKRLLWLLLLAFMLFFVVQSPAQAAEVVRSTGQALGDWLGTLAEALSRFVKSLTS